MANTKKKASKRKKNPWAPPAGPTSYEVDVSKGTRVNGWVVRSVSGFPWKHGVTSSIYLEKKVDGKYARMTVIYGMRKFGFEEDEGPAILVYTAQLDLEALVGMSKESWDISTHVFQHQSNFYNDLHFLTNWANKDIRWAKAEGLFLSAKKNPTKKKATKKKAAKKKATKNPNSGITLAIAKWYEKKGYMTPEIEIALGKVHNPKLLLSRLYTTLVYEDIRINWLRYAEQGEAQERDEFEKKAGVKIEDLEKLSDLTRSSFSKMVSGGASEKSDKGFKSITKVYSKAYKAIRGSEGLHWYKGVLVPLHNSNYALSVALRDTNNPAAIPKTLDFILEYVVNQRYYRSAWSDADSGPIFQEAILRAASRPQKTAADKGRTIPHVRRNPPKKKATKKKVAKKKATRKKTPPWQLLINRCQKLWDHYCERPSKARLKPVLAHLEKMKGSTSKKVADERKGCLRVANKEARRLKMK